MNGLKIGLRLLLCASFVSSLLFGTYAAKAQPAHKPQAAFIRGNDLWLLSGGAETKVTSGVKATAPKWSADGKFVAFAEGDNGDAIRVYSLESKRQFTVYDGDGNYQWAPAPGDNRLAFLTDGLLNTSVVTAAGAAPFRNVITGVGNYSWHSDGKGFLTSTLAQSLPNGWTSVQLFQVPADADMDAAKAKLLYTLPKQSDDFFAVGTSPFRWSADRKWIAFIAHPTASWSADSNTLCVLSANGRIFRTPANMLNVYDWFRWAPHRDTLAYMEGIGRFVLEDRKWLQTKDYEALKPPGLTPEGFVERDFTWVDDRTIVVSRSTFPGKHAADQPKSRPLPALYRIPLPAGEQRQLTRPPQGFGDFAPASLDGGRVLAWVRTDRTRADAWAADADGANAAVLIRGLDEGTSYYDRWNWDNVLAWYEPGP